ncbi:MAG TPA: dephospho-CoA kinase [Feifaniaceae bacterium]|nr:dephospho-CoA kinase [Feifaniaceae bacterium]
MSAQKMRRIGLTGGMGAGKSTVSSYLRALGAHVLDADLAARKAVEPGGEGLRLLAARYGAGILQPDGSLNRRALAGVIFNSDEERLAVNAILHPMVRSILLEEERDIRKTEPDAAVFWDVPLLIESNMHTDVDEVWLVTAEEAVRVARVMKRDNCGEQDALARIRRQMPEEEKARHAHRILDNSGDEAALLQQVKALYGNLKRER